MRAQTDTNLRRGQRACDRAWLAESRACCQSMTVCFCWAPWVLRAPSHAQGKKRGRLLGDAGVQLVEGLDGVAPVQDGAPLLVHLVEHKVPEQLQ